MRLTELTLENYGGCASRAIAIPNTAGLTVVFGANEAGKSTCLEAIADFLFAIPKNTQRGSLYGYDGMRIGASMLMDDGSILALKRRKGNGKTLADSSGAPFDENILAPVVGAITRERFETLFGLNHETLRNGGERLLHADGDIGRLIVEAGGGLRTLVSRLADIDSEADKLFDTRRSVNRVFYQQLSAFETADKLGRAAQLSRETYELTRKGALTAEQQLEALRAERRSLGVSTAKLERVLRSAPHLRQLDSLTQELAGYEDVAAYPDDFAATMMAMLDERDDAIARLEQAEERRNRLKARVDALVLNPKLKVNEQRIRGLAERAIHVSKARSDRTNRQREIDEGEAQLAALRRMLGLPGDTDLASLIPDQSALDHLRRLADEMVERRPGLANAQNRKQEIAGTIAEIDDRLQLARAKGFDKLPEASSSVFASLASQKSAHVARQKALDNDNAKLITRIQALGFETIEALTALKCPTAQDVRSEIAAHEQFMAQIEEQEKLKRQAQRDIVAGDATISELQSTGTIASDASLADARNLREDAWAPIKSAYITGKLPEDGSARLQSVDVFDAALLFADKLADRRAAEAERAAMLVQAVRRVTEAKAAITATEEELSFLIGQRQAREQSWSNNFCDASMSHPVLKTLLPFVEARQEVIEDDLRLREQNNALVVEEAQLAPTVELLERIEHSRKLDAHTSFASRIFAVQSAISKHEQAHAEYNRDVRDRDEALRQLKHIETELRQMETAQVAWDEAWPAATGVLGLKSDVTPAMANDAITEWAGARGVLSAIGLSRHRLQRMDEDEASLVADARQIAKELEFDVSDDCVVAAQMLLAWFNKNATAQTQYDSILPDYEEAKFDAEQAHMALSTATLQLANSAESVSLEATQEGKLREAVLRSAARSKLCNDIALSQQTAIDLGDKLDVDILRTEWGGRDLDEVGAELVETKARAVEVDAEIEAALLAEKAAQDELAAFSNQSDVNKAVAERESATTQMHTALERYLELSLAHELVTSAMATIRDEQQDPLITRAGELFTATTLGEFTGIEADIDDNGHPVVVGRRANGGKASIAAMSDGTRDQLFLAFRLASLENYGSATEPLPFIADDILVHFDDERSKSTLELLAQFAETTQVLLFTHHRSVRDLAEPLVASGRANIIDLGAI